MVQFFGNLESPASQGMSDFASEIGKGLGDFYTNYSANKRLQKITENPAFEDAPLSKKMQMLQPLEGYGEAGSKAAQKYLLSSQQKQQEDLSEAFNDMLEGKSLTPKQKKMMPPEIRQKFEQIELEKGKIDKKNKEASQDVKLADQMAHDAGFPELAGKNYPTNVMNQAINNQIKKNKVEKSTQPTKEELKREENLETYKSGLDVVNRMRGIRKRGNLGRGSSAVGFFGGQTAEDRGEYEQLGKSLISLSTNIPIRNRIEFDVLAHKLYDSSMTDREAEGTLKAMERILNNNIKKLHGEDTEEETGTYQNLPTPKEFSGKRMVDENTGKIYRSDGSKWIEEKK